MARAVLAVALAFLLASIGARADARPLGYIKQVERHMEETLDAIASADPRLGARMRQVRARSHVQLLPRQTQGQRLGLEHRVDLAALGFSAVETIIRPDFTDPARPRLVDRYRPRIQVATHWERGSASEWTFVRVDDTTIQLVDPSSKGYDAEARILTGDLSLLQAMSPHGLASLCLAYLFATPELIRWMRLPADPATEPEGIRMLGILELAELFLEISRGVQDGEPLKAADLDKKLRERSIELKRMLGVLAE